MSLSDGENKMCDVMMLLCCVAYAYYVLQGSLIEICPRLADQVIQVT